MAASHSCMQCPAPALVATFRGGQQAALCMVWDGLSSTRRRLCHLNKRSTKHPAHPIFMVGTECYIPHALRQAFRPSASELGAFRRQKIVCR